MKRLVISLAILLVSIFILFGCGTKATSTVPTTSAPAATTTAKTSVPAATITTAATPSPKYGGTFKYVSDSAPSGTIGYPPEILTASTESMQLCMEGLLREDNAGKPYPWLAESYKVADDLKSITFTLRKGVKFHDGSDFNAEVAKWNLENTMAAKLVPTWDSVVIVDNYTIRVNLKTWINTILRNFTDGSAAWMISKAAYDKNGLDWVRQNPVSTGPFKFVSFSRDSGLKTIKNPDYWGKDAQGNKLPYLEAIEILYVTDPTTQAAVIQSKGADAITISLGKMTSDMQKLGLKVFSDPVTVVALIPDTANSNSPWANQKVREAIEYGIDREAIAAGLGYGYWKAPYQTVPRAFAAYNPNFPIIRKYDLAKAKSLLAEAGYTSLKTTIIVNPLNGSKDAAVAVQDYLSKLGIEVTLDFPEFSKYQPSYLLGKWENAALLQVLPGFANYNATLDLYFGTSSVYLKSWQRTPEFSKLVTTSLAAPAPDISLIRPVVEQIAREVSVIPVWETGKNWAIQMYVMNGGFGERSLTPYWKPEQTWLNK